MTKSPKLPESVWVLFRPTITGRVQPIKFETTKQCVIDMALWATNETWPTLYKSGWRVAKYELKGDRDGK
jgi:hypothetical protein